MSRSLVLTLLAAQLAVAVTGSAAATRLAAGPAPLPARAPVAAAAPRPAVVITVAKPAPVRRAPAPHRPTKVVHRHAARPKPTPRPVRHHRVHRTVAAAPAVPVLTTLQRMQQAVARIPGASSATWLLVAKDGYWGTADWYTGTVYISPAVPSRRMYDVVAHEWSHLLQVRVYGGDVNATTAALNRWYGGTGLVGAERAADCMARRLGATWTHYTSCDNATWQQGAARLLSGRRL